MIRAKVFSLRCRRLWKMEIGRWNNKKKNRNSTLPSPAWKGLSGWVCMFPKNKPLCDLQKAVGNLKLRRLLTEGGLFLFISHFPMCSDGSGFILVTKLFPQEILSKFIYQEEVDQKPWSPQNQGPAETDRPISPLC
ncbi:hypothetical protein CEXT_48451 [Caerostris extrusa]|uniref:Uncharacterized protein n=1 Tax=Caerostris extrusa TaxID=172846 RepID=A0AAV4N238_CAEEX|nr:hypothetical protein CEXT_48451 [Caerostris extrusa]